MRAPRPCASGRIVFASVHSYKRALTCECPAAARILNIIGSGSNDSLTGDLNDNTIQGGAGNDNLYGKSGKDTLDGQGGTDFADGGAGTLDSCTAETTINCP